jgi:FkbM family methyltransferase
LTRHWLPLGTKTFLQQLVLGYHSFAPSFSCAGEDMILRHLIGPDKRDGFYVDVGAWDPVRLSNTYFFYLQGWRGINIDARPGSRSLFQKVRPRDINVEVGISTSAGELTYYVVEEHSPMNSFSREFLNHIGMLGEVTREIPVPVLPLAEVLERHLPKGQAIDFMSVDVEGHDLQALQSNDWERFRPRFLVVEDICTAGDVPPVVEFLRSRGYDVCARNVIILDRLDEYFFVDRSNDPDHTPVVAAR